MISCLKVIKIHNHCLTLGFTQVHK